MLKITFVLLLIVTLVTFLVIEFIVVEKYAFQELSYENIVNSRKELLKENVDRTIGDILYIEKDITYDYTVHVNLFAKEISRNLQSLVVENHYWNDYEEIIASIINRHVFESQSIYEEIDVLLYDELKEKVIYSTTGMQDMNTFLEKESQISISSTEDTNGIRVYVYLSSMNLNYMIKEKAKSRIRDLRVEGSEYLWVNEVINFNGGQDYGIRLVHPNLPETEGILLSTETKDIAGNKPYLVELEGVKSSGEIYFNYYFKEFDSDIISEKMTYAKLYEPYNWIIATGIYISDIKELQIVVEENHSRVQVLSMIMLVSFVALGIVTYMSARVLYSANEQMKYQIEKDKDTKEEIAIELDVAKDLAYKDSLTNLLNRRGLFERLDEELSRYKRQKYSLVVILADIDYFKNINDTYGHAFGDEALKHVARIITKNVRKEDIIGRLGGDEFLYILPYTNLDQAKILIEEINIYLNNNILKYSNESVPVTLSVGITQANEDDDVDSIIKRADFGMYQSKRAGKNKISVV